MLTYDQAGPGATLKAKRLCRDSTVAEKILWRALRAKLPGFKWRRQMPVGPYFVDFACYAERLVVELDGGQHANAMDYDRSRTRLLNSQGYRVLRFWNNDVMDNIDGVLEAIASEISSPSRSFAAPSLSQGRGVSSEAAQ